MILPAVFKKYHSRKISHGQKLKDLVVGNFLNIVTLTAVMVLATLITLHLAFHLRCRLQFFLCLPI